MGSPTSWGGLPFLFGPGGRGGLSRARRGSALPLATSQPSTQIPFFRSSLVTMGPGHKAPSFAQGHL